MQLSGPLLTFAMPDGGTVSSGALAAELRSRGLVVKTGELLEEPRRASVPVAQPLLLCLSLSRSVSVSCCLAPSLSPSPCVADGVGASTGTFRAKNGSIRLSFHLYNTEADVDRLVRELAPAFVAAQRAACSKMPGGRM